MIEDSTESLDMSSPNSLWAKSEGTWYELPQYINSRVSNDSPRIWKLHDRVWVTDWISSYFLTQDTIPTLGSVKSQDIINSRSSLSDHAQKKISDWIANKLSSKLNSCTVAMEPPGSLSYFVTTFDDIQDSLMFKLHQLADLMTEYPMVRYLDVTSRVELANPARSEVSNLFNLKA